MPLIAPALRAILLLTGAGGIGYTFYQQNPAFKAFVDRITKQITDFWDDLLSRMSPEEREQAREEQRRILLAAFPWNAAAGLEESRQQRAGSTEGSRSTEERTATGADTGSSNEQDGKLRRRKLWEIAEQNAEEIRKRAAARAQKKGAAGQNVAGQDSAPSNIPAAGSFINNAAATALHSHPTSDPPHLDESIAEETREALHPDPPTSTLDYEQETYSTPTAAAPTSSTSPHSGMSTPTILTPPSPSLASVSGTSTDTDFDPPLIDIDDLLSEQGFNVEHDDDRDMDAATDTGTETMSMSQVSVPRSVSDFGAARTPALPSLMSASASEVGASASVSQADADDDDVQSLASGLMGSEDWTSAATSEGGDFEGDNGDDNVPSSSHDAAERRRQLQQTLPPHQQTQPTEMNAMEQYHLSRALLEQQNKKRAILARQES